MKKQKLLITGGAGGIGSVIVNALGSEYEIDVVDNLHNGFLENIKIYIIAFVRYINESDNIIYFGIILILISLILYFLNITRGNKNE